MATQKFKPGDKVKFTQKAKDRFGDDNYWHCANYPKLNLDRVYTIAAEDSSGSWLSYTLKEEGTAPCTPGYLLEPAETEQTKNKMTKKKFIMALVRAISNEDMKYEGCKPYPIVHLETDNIIVKCYKDKKGDVTIALLPMYDNFGTDETEAIKNFMKQDKKLSRAWKDLILTENGDIFMTFSDYPWHVMEVPGEEQPADPCIACAVVRKLQAEIQRLKYELYQAKTEKPQTSSDWHKKPKRATVTFEF